MNNYQYFPNMYQPTNEDSRIWVQGLSSAEAYLVAPNSFVRLWDSAKPVFYEKRADATGRPCSIDIYEYKRIEAPNSDLISNGTNDYKAEFERLNERITALENSIKKENKRNVSKSDSNVVRISEIQE